jgi:hypothetical protein
MRVDYTVYVYDIQSLIDEWIEYTYTYDVKKPEKITNNFSIAYCNPGMYLLYHTASMKTITMGKKGKMKELAHLIENDFVFDGVSSWLSKDNKTVIRSLSEIY